MTARTWKVGMKISKESFNLIIKTVQHDWKSKWVDGLATASILGIVTMSLNLLIVPFSRLFDNNAGLLLYSIGILAISALCLERGLLHRYPEHLRAWHGLVGGVVGWMFIEVSNDLAAVSLTSVASVLALFMVCLVLSILWRRGYLPLGAKFFCLGLLVSWIGQIWILSLHFVTVRIPSLEILNPITGWLNITCFLISLALLFLKTNRRVQRLSFALFIWLFAYQAYQFLIV